MHGTGTQCAHPALHLQTVESAESGRSDAGSPPVRLSRTRSIPLVSRGVCASMRVSSSSSSLPPPPRPSPATGPSGDTPMPPPAAGA
eukprot:scaffold116510_cov30-Phaeocystis_antarctica.AAC.1